MKCEIRLPRNYKEYGSPSKTMLSNLDNSVDYEIISLIKGKPLFSRYAAWNFNGLIWWHGKLGYWCGEVWVSGKYVTTYLAETVEALANEINDEHGKGEKPLFT
jgi:hypothetical protein